MGKLEQCLFVSVTITKLKSISRKHWRSQSKLVTEKEKQTVTEF